MSDGDGTGAPDDSGGAVAAGTPRADSEEFARRLAEYREDGATVLVVGTDCGAQAALARRLVGAPTDGAGQTGGTAERHRVFGLAGGETAVARALADLDARTVRLAGGERSAAGGGCDPRPGDRGGPGAAGGAGGSDPRDATAPSDGGAGWGQVRRVESPGAFGAALAEELGSVAARSPPPGSLRVAVDSVGVLWDGLGRGGLADFWQLLAARATGEGAILHAHLHAEPGGERAHFAAQLADCVVAVRDPPEGGPECRWRVDDVVSDWLDVGAI